MAIHTEPSPIFSKRPGPLARFIQQGWNKDKYGTMNMKYWRVPESNIVISTQVIPYSGKKSIDLGSKSWKLNPGDTILFLHLDNESPGKRFSFREINSLWKSVRETLYRGVTDELRQYHGEHEMYVMAASNYDLINILTKLVPEFMVVDHLSPGSLVARTTIEYAADHDPKFGNKVRKLPIPVVAVRTKQFVETLRSKVA